VNRLNRFVTIAYLLFFFPSFLCCSGQGQKTKDREGANPADVLESARIYPRQAYADNHLEVRFKTDFLTKLPEFAYTWKRNGVVIPGVTGNSLAPASMQKGDQISVEIAFFDSASTRRVFSPPAVTILNTPPKILEASLELASNAVPMISVTPRCLDADKDRIVCSYRWFRNGKTMDGQTGATLDPLLAQRQDDICAEIIASDGETSSPPFRTEPFKLQNHPPRITSSPPTATSGAQFIYKVVCGDPDGDKIFYELLSGPPQMSIDENGKIEWAVPRGEERKPAYEVGIRVTDGHGGEAVQRFTFSLATPEPKQ
jgi:hypothetical protein